MALPLKALNVAAVIVYGLPLTNSPALRVREANVVLTLAVSLMAVTLPLISVTLRLTTPVKTTGIPDNVGSSAP